jgi:hypothetical protein
MSVFLKSRLHLRFLLRFLVRFSPSDGCERVMSYECSEYMNPHLNIHKFSTRSHTSEEENAPNIAAKIASINRGRLYKNVISANCS